MAVRAPPPYFCYILCSNYPGGRREDQQRAERRTLKVRLADMHKEVLVNGILGVKK